MKKFFQILFWLALLTGVGVVLAFVSREHRETVCNDFELVIIDHPQHPLIGVEDLKAQIIEKTDTLHGKTLAEINTLLIHDILMENPYIRKSDIITSINGNLKVNVWLREAVVRIIKQNGHSYYIDRSGHIMPVNAGYPARTLIANGYINDGLTEITGKENVKDLPPGSVTRNIYEMAMLMEGSPLLGKLITQIWLNRQGELLMIPLVGDNEIYFGGFDNMEEKFNKLVTYYREGAGKAGWIDYKSIDLRYDNQVICSKK